MKEDIQIKLAAFDLDGTLLNSKKEISAKNLEAIEAAMDKGVHIVLATRRTVNGIPEELLCNKRIEYAICSNGASVVNLKEEKVIYKNYLTMETIEKVLEYIGDMDPSIDFLIDGKVVTEERNKKRIMELMIPESMISYIIKTRTWVPDILEYASKKADKIEKLNLFFQNKTQRKEVIDILSKMDEITITSSLEHNLEINTKNTNKGEALFYLSKHLDLKMEEIMACGDSYNDIEMLKVAGFSVAMENGNKELKQVAKIVTKTNDEDGIYEVLKKYIY